MFDIDKIPINKFVIIGSYPLGIRYCKDIDIICYEKDIQVKFNKKDEWSGSFEFQGKRIELLFADNQESFRQILCYSLKIAHPNILYAIKRAHIYFPNKNWEKHMSDLCILKRIIGWRANDPVTTRLIKLHKYSTELRLGKQKLPKLKGVSKEHFFDDNVVKFYQHDDLHQIFAHKEKPMYSYMQKNKDVVDCDENLWNKFNYTDKINCVLEECYVIASERQLIPTTKGIKVGMIPHNAFKWALMRVCTTLCGGFFREFAIDNYINILNSYDKYYYKKLEKLKDLTPIL